MPLKMGPADNPNPDDFEQVSGPDPGDFEPAGPQMDSLSPDQAEAKREQVEGPGPELADAPVANAVLAGALTPGAWARLGLESGETGLKAALKGGIDFGAQQGLQDWVENKLPAGLQNHPWLKEALGIAGGTAMYAAGKGALSLPANVRAAQGVSVLQKLAQSRAISEPEEALAGTAQPIFEGAKPEEAPSAEQAVAPTEKSAEPSEAAPATEATPEAEKPPEGPQPIAMQPKEELNAAVEKGDTPAAKEALQQELSRHPDASVYEMRVGDLKKDPERFQYKTNVRQGSGEDPTLRDVGVYDRGLGGVLTAYHDRDGYYVVNGHGRAAALERLEGQDATHRVQVIESRANDDPNAVPGAIKYGWTPEQARGYGAMINIAEGRGTAMDAARFFRQQGMDTAAMKKAGISMSPTEEKTQRAVSLANLSGQLWRAVDHGVVPEKLGVVIGHELGDNPTAQDGLYSMLKKEKGDFGDVSASKLGEMIRLAKGSGEAVEKSMTLFGPEEMKKSLMSEQADVINGIKARLRGEKRLFGTAAAGAQELESAGVGKVDADTGERLSGVAAQNLDLLGRTAYTSGPVNQAIRDAAQQLSEAPGNKAKIVKQAYSRVADELSKMLPEQPEASPQESMFAMGGTKAEPPAEKAPDPEDFMDLGVGLPVVQAAERIYRALPEDIRNKPAELGKAVQRTFAPETDGAFAQRAAEVQESKAAELRARIGSAANAVEPLREHFQTLPKELRNTLASEMEKGNFDALPDFLKPLGPAMKAITDSVHDRLQRLTPDQQIGYRDFYWRHLWADSPEEVQNAFERMRAGSGKSLTAGKGFLRQRRFPTIQDGVDMGLTPKFENPVDQWLAGVQQEWRYATGKEMWNAIKDTGVAKYYRVTDKIPKDVEKIHDTITRVMTSTDKGVAHIGDWYVPKEVARIFNNYLDPGLGQTPWQSISALGNRIRVEFSGFHFELTSLSHVAIQTGAHLAEAMGDIANGNIARGAFKLATTPWMLAKSPTEVYKDWRLGRDTISQALKGNFDDPAVHDALMGGEGFNYAWDNPGRLMGETWKDVFGIPGRLAEKLNPIMKHWVAPLKVGTFLRLYNAKLGEAMKASGGDEIPFVQRRTIATQVRRHVDNVMGQISRDNLHFSNGMKDWMHRLIAYPGWQVGSVKLFGGTTRGILKGSARMLGSDVKLDTQAQMALRFTAGMLVTGGTIGALANYMMTGKLPRSVNEAFMWPTGEKDANGNDIRTEPPEYLVRDAASMVGHKREQNPNDVLRWPKAILASTVSKVNWPLAAAAYIVRNADFFGKPFSFPDIESQPKQVYEIVKQIANEGGVPFSVKNAYELAAEGKEPLKSVLSGALGMTPESRALRQTPAQNFVDQHMPKIQTPQTPDDIANQQLLRQARTDVRKEQQGGPPANLDALKAAVESGKISQRQFDNVFTQSTQRPFAAALNNSEFKVSDALQAWKIARDNGDEQDEKDAAAAIEKKLMNNAQVDPFRQGILRKFLESRTESEEATP